MGELANFTIDQVAGAMALTLGSIGGLCLILFKSRCETISICWGLWTCNRKVQEEDSSEDDKKEEQSSREPTLVPSPEPEPDTPARV
tara:strand:- start:1868 stop:2128 length:261 start_codon:yes stop_codon:yes gene_type:complete